MGNLPKFDEAGNVILIKPPKIEELKEELEIIINGNHLCKYCESKWKSKFSKERHEAWCKKNPNRRTSHWNPTTPKKPKKAKKPKGKTGATLGRPVKINPIIKELKAFDKVFGLTDEQIAKYIRGLMK
jgi:hypothetical protein